MTKSVCLFFIKVMYDENIGIVEGMLGKLDSRLSLADSFIFYYLPLNLTKKICRKRGEIAGKNIFLNSSLFNKTQLLG